MTGHFCRKRRFVDLSFLHIFTEDKSFIFVLVAPNIPWTKLQEVLISAMTWQNKHNECAPGDPDQPGHPFSLVSLRCAISG